jgi:hypothetical protein
MTGMTKHTHQREVEEDNGDEEDGDENRAKEKSADTSRPASLTYAVMDVSIYEAP